MADIVNLRTVRKRAQRRQDGQHADANRLAHGQSKALRYLKDAQQTKAEHNLDGHKREPGDGR